MLSNLAEMNLENRQVLTFGRADERRSVVGPEMWIGQSRRIMGELTMSARHRLLG